MSEQLINNATMVECPNCNNYFLSEPDPECTTDNGERLHLCMECGEFFTDKESLHNNDDYWDEEEDEDWN